MDDSDFLDEKPDEPTPPKYTEPLFVTRAWRKPLATPTQLAMHLVRARYGKLETVLNESGRRGDNFLVRHADKIMILSHQCLSRIYAVIRSGEVTPDHKEEMLNLRRISENIYQHLGVIFYAKGVLNSRDSNSFLCGMLKCFLSLSPLELCKSQRVALIHMGLMMNPMMVKNCKHFLTGIMDMGPYDTCYSTTLRIRLSLAKFGYNLDASPNTLDITDMTRLSKTAVQAALRTQFAPWIFVCLLNNVFTCAKKFGIIRLANYRYQATITPSGTILDASLDTIDAIRTLREFMPHICHEDIHNFVDLLECILMNELGFFKLPPKQPKRRNTCWDIKCYGGGPYGDVMRKFDMMNCRPPGKQAAEPLHEKRGDRLPPWKIKTIVDK